MKNKQTLDLNNRAYTKELTYLGQLIKSNTESRRNVHSVESYTM